MKQDLIEIKMLKNIYLRIDSSKCTSLTYTTSPEASTVFLALRLFV